MLEISHLHLPQDVALEALIVSVVFPGGQSVQEGTFPLTESVPIGQGVQGEPPVPGSLQSAGMTIVGDHCTANNTR